MNSERNTPNPAERAAIGGASCNGGAGAQRRGSKSAKTRTSGLTLKKYLEGLRVASLRELVPVWLDDPGSNGTKKELVARLYRHMSEEGIVYRRVRQLTRRALDVLLLFLRRAHYTSDLPGLFQRLPGEAKVNVEFHEAETGIKALVRRGFLAERIARGTASNGRVLYSVPTELGTALLALFREETRTVASLLSLREHMLAMAASERARLRKQFPDLAELPGEGDVDVVLRGGASARIDALPTDVRAVVNFVLQRHRGFVRRAQWSRRHKLKNIRWDRAVWGKALEAEGVGTVARTSLKRYGLACDDEALVIFREIVEGLIEEDATTDAPPGELMAVRGDFVADLCLYLETARRTPLKVSRSGEVYKTSRRKIESKFVSRESPLNEAEAIWDSVRVAATRLGLVQNDDEGFLELLPTADSFLRQPLEDKLRSIYTLAVEQPGSKGRSLHQHEMRKVLADVLRDHPQRWWPGRSLAAVVRHRYLESMDALGIPARYKDRFFSAYFSQRETPADLLGELDRHWLRRLHGFGMLDAVVQAERVVAWRLSSLGARVLGAEVSAEPTGLVPLLVNPDFEILVLPEGDVSDVVHTLDQFAKREKTGDVVHFRLTREAIESAVGAGRSIEEFLQYLASRSRNAIPQNVEYSIRSWAGSVTFATYERGVILKTQNEEAMDRILAIEGVQALLIRRLLPEQALLRQVPDDKKLLAQLREHGIELRAVAS